MKLPLHFKGGLIALLVVGAAACHTDQSTSPTNETRSQIAAPIHTSAKTLAAAAGGYVSSTDSRGLPTFIWAVGDHHAEPADGVETAAQRHLVHFAPSLGVTARDLDTAEVRFARQIGSGGYIVKYRQKINGVEVYPSEVAVLMRSNLDLVAISGHLHSASLASGTAVPEFSAEQAFASALTKQLGVAVTDGQVLDVSNGRSELRRFTISDATGVHMPQPAAVRNIFYAGGEKLEAAYFIEFYARTANTVGSDAYRYIVSAKDGRVLQTRDLMANDAVGYRVWAEATGNGRPFDAPTEDVTPHPTGIPDMRVPNLIPSNLVVQSGFNKNPDGVEDPWLPSGSTETFGNNVDAYTDDNTPDGYSNGDIRAITTAADTFDRTFDFTIDANATEDQSMASVTELFYVTNWLHDWYYDSGFNEVAGNAQLDNFERGGLGGDVMHAEAQDSLVLGARNNANMSTPSDGMSPRMQMYQWSGPTDAYVEINGPNLFIDVGTAGFGPTNFNRTGDLVAVNDGTAAPGGGTTTDGCESYSGVTGRVVLVDRGLCAFTLKAVNAQAAGAVGIIIANNRPAATPPGLGGVDPSITIPTLSVLQTDGADLRMRLAMGAVNVTMYRLVGIDRDGSQDHQVVGHEWGHYLHHRNADCGSPACRGMSEGWGDFNSLYFGLHEGDNVNGSYATGVYATRTFGDASYFGIRRTPYSADMTKDGLMFHHISDGALPPNTPFNGGGANSEVHNAGEVWCTMMWQTYMALLGQVDGSPGAPTFDEMQRRMSDYVVAGLQMHPLDATHTEARDSILAAIAASGRPTDLAAAVNAFAVRGAGSCAVSPDRYSADLVGVVEGTAVQPRVLINSVTFDESIHSCDNDGVLDAEEVGRLLVTVSNASPVDLVDLTLTLTASEAGILFPAGSSVQVASLPPYGEATIELQVGLDSSLTAVQSMTIGVHALSASSCEQTVTSTVISRVNYDVQTSSTTDTVESPNSHWIKNGTNSDFVWNRTQIEPLAYAYVGIDSGADSDTNFESPSLNVNGTDPFVISFDERYSFEFSSATFWDGGVIELSPDDGQTWSDLSTYIDPGYDGELTDTSGNPLALRMAYGATSPNWPARDHKSFDLGTQLAGQTVKIRFRIGSDANTGDYGWELDNIHFDGIDNTPFDVLVDDTTICPPLLTANAGPDQTVNPKDVVVLDGTASSSFDMLPLTFSWAQTVGPTVSMTGADTARPIFAAPEVGAMATLTFELTVNDGTRTQTDTVDIIVNESEALVANAGADQTVDAHAVVVLDGTASHTAAGLPLTFTWAQTAGDPVSLAGSSSAVARFEAPAAVADKTYTFTLTVSDGTRMATDTVDIVVTAVGALAVNAGPDQTVDVGAVVVLDGSGSMSAAGLPLQFSWAKTTGPDVTLESANAVVARFTATGALEGETIVFTLTVSDGVHQETDTVSVTVNAVAPALVTADAGMNRTVDAGATVALDGSASRSSANLPLTYAWSQTAGPNVVLSNAAGAATTFTAPTSDQMVTLSFKLVVSDGTQMAEDTVDVVVRPVVAPPPTDEGCGCSTTETHEGRAASALIAIGGLALALLRRRGR